MTSQPSITNDPTIPPPQTVCGVMAQHGMPTYELNQLAPGESPDFTVMLARNLYIGTYEYSTTDKADSSNPVVTIPLNSCEVTLPTPHSITKAQSGTPWDFAFSHCMYWNGSIKLTFWAVKPPMANGRLVIGYLPPGQQITSEQIAQTRFPLVEWDLSATDFCEIVCPVVNPLEWRKVHPSPIADSLTSSDFPLDMDLGTVHIYVASDYTPGGIFPDKCYINMFKSIVNPQLRTITCPPWEKVWYDLENK